MEISLLAALIGGVLTVFAPCSAMLLPAFFAYAFSSRRTLLLRTLALIMGVLVVLVPIGAFAGTLGSLIRQHAAVITTVAGIVIIVLGTIQMFAVTFTVAPVLHRWRRKPQVAVSPGFPAQREPSSLAVFSLGVGYAIAAVGCSGPILGAVLSFAALGANPLKGGILMSIFAIGMTIPVIVLTLVWDGLEVGKKRWLQPRPVTIFGRHTTVMNIVSGAIFVGLGVVLTITGGNVHLPALFTADQQIAIETSVMRTFSAVPSWLFLALIVVLVAIALLSIRRTKR